MKTIPIYENHRLFHHLSDLEKTICHAFSNLWEPVKLGLGGWATGLLQGKTEHLLVNLVGDPNLDSATVSGILADLPGENLTLKTIPNLDQSPWKTKPSLWGHRMQFLNMDECFGLSQDERLKGKVPIPLDDDRLLRCRRAVNQFYSIVREMYEGKKVPWNYHKDNSETLEWIHQLATLQGKLREQSSQLIYESLHTLARGLALLTGRTHLTQSEIALLLYLTISSMPPPFERIFLGLITQESECIEYGEMQSLLKEYPSIKAEEIMKKIHQLGIMEYVQQDQEDSAYLKLREEWAWIQDKKLWWWYSDGYAGDVSACFKFWIPSTRKQVK